jgi:AraC-like DNA-binding protein
MEVKLWKDISLLSVCLVPDEEFVTHFHEILQQKAFDSRYSVPKLCRDVGMSSSKLHRKLVALTGCSAITHIIALRLERAKALLLSCPQLHVNQIAFECGFDDPDYFSRVFSRQFGMAPTRFKQLRKLAD